MSSVTSNESLLVEHVKAAEGPSKLCVRTSVTSIRYIYLFIPSL
jgi:hypothetical protein